MSSSGPAAWQWCTGLVLVVAPATCAWAQTAPDEVPRASADAATPVTAKQALDTARDAYQAAPEQTVTACPEDAVEADEKNGGGDVIVVCRQVNTGAQYRIEHVPSARLDQTADGAPRPPDLDTIPPCVPSASTVCVKFGRAPPPVLMVDVTKFPHPLPPEVAAKVTSAPLVAGDPVPPPVTGRRIAIPLQ